MNETGSCGFWGERQCHVRQFWFSVTRVLRSSDRCRMFPPVSLRIITAQLLVNQACGLDGSFSMQPKKLGVLECHLENFESVTVEWYLFSESLNIVSMVLPKRSCLCASVRSSDWFGARFSFRWFGNFIQMVLEKSVRIFLIIVSFHSFRAQSLCFLCSALFTFYALPWSWDCLMWRCMLWSISNAFILSKLLK